MFLGIFLMIHSHCRRVDQRGLRRLLLKATKESEATKASKCIKCTNHLHTGRGKGLVLVIFLVRSWQTLQMPCLLPHRPQTLNRKQAIIISLRKADLGSLIMRIKCFLRMRKIPVHFDDYAHSLMEPGYNLSSQEKIILVEFIEYYNDR